MMNREDIFVGLTLIPSFSTRNYHSGIRVTEINENGFVVQRIHAQYLDHVETWQMRWNQLETCQWIPIPIGGQLPLL